MYLDESCLDEDSIGKFHTEITRAAYKSFQRDLKQQIYQFDPSEVWNPKTKTWKSKLPAYTLVNEFGPKAEYKLIQISRPAICLDVFTRKPRSLDKIPCVCSDKHNWVIYKFGDRFYGINESPDYYNGEYPGPRLDYLAEHILARYPTLLKFAPHWNRNVGARVRLYALANDTEPENYLDITKPLTPEEMESYEAMAALVS